MSNQQYTAGFVTEAVKQDIERGHTVEDVAAPLGLPEHTLYDSVQKARKAAGQTAVPSESAAYFAKKG